MSYSNNMKTFYMLWCKVFLGSLLFVGLFIYSLKSLENKSFTNERKIHFTNNLTIDEIKNSNALDYDMLFMSCILEEKNKLTCHEEILEKYNLSSNDKDEISMNNRNNIIIYIIYFMLAVVLNSQITLFLYSRDIKEKLDNFYFNISDWSINSAPLLGVLGTIMAFALLVSNSRVDDISELFGRYFFDAAITTLLGGFIYIHNLFLNIFIQPKIKVQV